MLRLAAVAGVVAVATWGLLAFLATRLPEGPLKELAGVLPASSTTVRRLFRDPRVPGRAKLAVGFALLWVLSPIDLVPEFLPVIGPVDDVVIVALALRYAARRTPPAAVFDAWPADPRLLERLLGSPAPARRRGG